MDDINGFSYIMSNFQHAGDWTGKPSDETKAIVGPLIDETGAPRRFYRVFDDVSVRFGPLVERGDIRS